MSEKQFEPCTLEEATHVEVNGKMYQLGHFPSECEVLKFNGHYISVFRITGMIHVDAFPFLGIKPMREVKQEPIVFEATFVKNDGQWHTLAILNDSFAYLNNKRVRFRCVEILEEEK